MTSPVDKLAFALIYSEDLDTTVSFYQKYLGLVVDESVKMSATEVFGNMGPVGVWIGGGYKKTNSSDRNIRATVMLRVKSSGELFAAFKKGDVKLYQPSPIQMGQNNWWFQFADNNGNILDVLGGE